MAISDDDINDALNRPTDELGNESDDPEYDDPDIDPDADPDNDPDVDPDGGPEDEPTGDDLVDTLLGKAKPESRVQRLANERREAQDRADAAERRLHAIEEEMARRAKANDDAMEARRRQELEEMDPVERRLLENEQEARRARFEASDMRDAQNFRSVVDRNPQLKQLADDVEKELAAARRSGQNPTREAVARFLLGDRAMKALLEGPKVKAAAKKRVENARGRPVGASSNTTEREARRSGSSDFEKKYGNLKI